MDDNEKKPSVVVRNKTVGDKMRGTFMGDRGKEIGSYVYHDICKPVLLDTAYDIITSIASILLYGEVNTRHRRFRGGTSTGYTSYGSVSSTSTSRRPSYRTSENQPKIVNKDTEEKLINIVDSYCFEFYDRIVAEAVINEIDEWLMTYQQIDVGSLYDLIKKVCKDDVEVKDLIADFTRIRLGWYAEELRDLGPKHSRGGFCIALPPPHNLD